MLKFGSPKRVSVFGLGVILGVMALQIAAFYCKLPLFLVIEGSSEKYFFFIYQLVVVGAARFELATYGTQNRRATRLRHAPMARPLQGKGAHRKRAWNGNLPQGAAVVSSGTPPSARIR